MSLKTLGSLVEKERKKKGLSRDDVSMNLNISSDQLKYFEKGASRRLPEWALSLGTLLSIKDENIYEELRRK